MKKLFSLVELVVVILILVFLTAIVIPNVQNQKESALIASIQLNVKSIQTGVDIYTLENKGLYPTEHQPQLGEPKPIDLSKLKPEYIRDLPKIDNVKYWIDVWGTVWASTVDAPTDISIVGTTLSWGEVSDSKGYNVYEVSDISSTGNLQINKKIKLLSNTPIKENKLENIDPSKNYLVSSIDAYGLETPPVGTQYEGYVKKEKPLKPCDADGYICIYTPEDLYNIRNNLDGKYRLANSIDLSSYPNWKPIGRYIGYVPTGATFPSDREAFRGVLDGNGLSIKNLAITNFSDSSVDAGVGLFGYIDQAVIKNLTLKNVNIQASNFNRVGGLAGGAFDSDFINIKVDGIVKGKNSVGGVLGDTTSYWSFSTFGDITNVSFNGVVEGNDYVGGLIGSYNLNVITNSYANAQVKGESYVGGLIGRATGQNIYQSYSTGTVEGKYRVGGLIGEASFERNPIDNTYSTSVVKGRYYVGGLIGYSQGSAIYHSYFAGKVKGEQFVGGIIGDAVEGYTRSTENTFSLAESIEGNSAVGIVIGYDYSDGRLSPYLNTLDIPSFNRNFIKYSITREQSLQKQTYINEDWDFNNIWSIKENQELPVFKWQE